MNRDKTVKEKILDILQPHFGLLQSCQLADEIIEEFKTTGRETHIVPINHFQVLEIKLTVK
jgi:hypothetical protein